MDSDTHRLKDTGETDGFLQVLDFPKKETARNEMEERSLGTGIGRKIGTPYRETRLRDTMQRQRQTSVTQSLRSKNPYNCRIVSS